MEIKKINTDFEKQIIIGLIVSDEFNRMMSDIIEPGLLKLSYGKIVANWCLDYYKKYKQSPHKNIQEMYKHWAKDNSNEELIKIIGVFLENLSGEYVRENNFNEQYVFDESLKYLNRRKRKILKQQIEEAEGAGLDEEAERLIQEYRIIQLPIKEYTDVWEDIGIVDEVVNSEEEDIFSFSGALGKTLKGSLKRGDLISFIAPAKRGKTFFLIEAAKQASLRGLRVVFFSFEMTRNQILSRIYQNITGEPKREKEISVPEFIKNEYTNKFVINWKDIKKSGIDSKKIKNKIKGLKSIKKGGRFKLFCSAGNKTSVTDMANICDNLVRQENFVPDIIVVDYADIIRSEYKSDQHRHKINNNWEGLKGLALSKHCLVITATHSNKQTFDRDIKQGDASEDIRKINHVSVMLGINQSKDEKKKNIARISTLANRSDDFHVDDDIVVLQCLAIGNPILDSRFSREVEGYEK